MINITHKEVDKKIKLLTITDEIARSVLENKIYSTKLIDEIDKLYTEKEIESIEIDKEGIVIQSIYVRKDNCTICTKGYTENIYLGYELKELREYIETLEKIEKQLTMCGE